MLHLALVSLCLVSSAAQAQELGSQELDTRDTIVKEQERRFQQDLRWVPADADVVVHFDLESAQRTLLGRRLLRSGQEGSTGVGTVDDFSRWTKRRKLRIGSDLRRITIYGRPGDKTLPVAIVAMER